MDSRLMSLTKTLQQSMKPKAPRERRRNIFRRIFQHRMAYVFILPAVLAMLLIHIIPTVQALYMSLLDLNVRTLLQYLRAPFVGFAHYEKIIGGIVLGTGDANIKGLFQALINSFWFCLWLQIGTLGIGLILALLLNRKFWGRGLARTLVLLPWVVPTFVVGIVFQFIWLQRGGLANRFYLDFMTMVPDGFQTFLHTILTWLLTGMDKIFWFWEFNPKTIAWLLNPKPISWLIGPNARTALIIAGMWSGLPFPTVMLLANLQVIPQDLYEAASVDGANGWQRFRYITLPYLKPIMVITTMFGIIYNFFGFGPYNIATSMFNTALDLGKHVNLLLIVIVRQTFNNQLYGYGAAASVLMTLIALVAIGLFYWLFRSSMISE